MRLENLIAALCFAPIVFSAGAHAVVPFRLRRVESEARRLWALAAAPLLAVAALAFLILADRSEDALLASRLVPFSSSRASLALGVTSAGLLLADLLLLVSWRRLEDFGWTLLALFGAAAAVAQGFLLAALSGGESAAPAGALVCRAAVLAALAFASAESITQGLPRLASFASFAGLGLPLFALALPREVRETFVGSGGLAYLGAAAALLFATRFGSGVHRRRAAALAALLLAGLAWAKAVDISAALIGQSPPAERLEVD